MRALIENSEVCYQEIQVSCILAPLTLYGQELGSFKDVNCENNNLSEHICDGTCNCDANSGEIQMDSGRITDPDLLPLAGFSYGPLDFEGKKMNLTMSPLICSGNKTYL